MYTQHDLAILECVGLKGKWVNPGQLQFYQGGDVISADFAENDA